jgi:Flp pilus assembly protein TadB
MIDQFAMWFGYCCLATGAVWFYAWLFDRALSALLSAFGVKKVLFQWYWDSLKKKDRQKNIPAN